MKLIKYEVVGILHNNNQIYDFSKAFIQGKRKYPRIIIKKININEQ